MPDYTLYPKVTSTGDLPPLILERLDERYVNTDEVRPSTTAGVSVMDYGAQAGTTTDQAPAFRKAIEAAAAQGLPVVVPPGTYSMNGGLVFPAGSTFEMAPGAVLDYSKSSATNYLNVQGATGARVNSAAIAAGAFTIPLAGHTLTAGSWCLIRSADVFDPDSTSSPLGELIQVASVDAGQVTFRTAVCDDYKTSVTVTPVTLVPDVTIRGGAVRGSKIAGDNRGGLRADMAENLRIEGVRFEDIDRAHVFIKSSVNCWVSNCVFLWAESTTMGYGVSFGDSIRDSGCLLSTFRGVRHSFTTNNTATAQDGGVPRRILFFGNTVEDTTVAQAGSQLGGDAVDTHTASEDIWIVQNSVNKSTGHGINVECPSALILNNTVQDSASDGINFHNEAGRPGRVTIRGNVVRRSGGHGIRARTGGRGSTTPTESLIVCDNRVQGAALDGITAGYILTDRGAVVTGNTVIRAAGVSLRLVKLNGVVAAHNNVTGGASKGVEYATVTNGVLGPDAVRADAPTGAWTGVTCTNVTNSVLTPGAIAADVVGGVGVDVGSSCSRVSLGKTAHINAPTQITNNAGSTVS